MTHDELLLEITMINQSGDRNKNFEALRAVMELHKPEDKHWGGNLWCPVCSDKEGDFIKAYPCTTIQAIEKELK